MCLLRFLNLLLFRQVSCILNYDNEIPEMARYLQQPIHLNYLFVLVIYFIYFLIFMLYFFVLKKNHGYFLKYKRGVGKYQIKTLTKSIAYRILKCKSTYIQERNTFLILLRYESWNINITNNKNIPLIIFHTKMLR